MGRRSGQVEPPPDLHGGKPEQRPARSPNSPLRGTNVLVDGSSAEAFHVRHVRPAAGRFHQSATRECYEFLLAYCMPTFAEAAGRQPLLRRGTVVKPKLIRFLAFALAVLLLSQTARADDKRMGTGSDRDDDTGGSVNLSRDLVRLGIASKNLPVDDPSFDARPLFEAAVQYVGTHHVERLTVDRGAYYFLTPQDSLTYFRFPSLSDLTVDLAGSKIFFAGAFLQGFTLVNCDRVTLTLAICRTKRRPTRTRLTTPRSWRPLPRRRRAAWLASGAGSGVAPDPGNCRPIAR